MQSFVEQEPPSEEPPELLELEKAPSGNVIMNGFPLSTGGVEVPLSCEVDDASSPVGDDPLSSTGAVASSPEVHAPQPLLEKPPDEDCEPPLELPPPELDEPVDWNPWTSGTAATEQPAVGHTAPTRPSPRIHGSA
jgi:hypothetical protein